MNLRTILIVLFYVFSCNINNLIIFVLFYFASFKICFYIVDLCSFCICSCWIDWSDSFIVNTQCNLVNSFSKYNMFLSFWGDFNINLLFFNDFFSVFSRLFNIKFVLSSWFILLPSWVASKQWSKSSNISFRFIFVHFAFWFSSLNSYMLLVSMWQPFE